MWTPLMPAAALLLGSRSLARFLWTVCASLRESATAWLAGPRVAPSAIRRRLLQAVHWLLRHPRVLARAGADADLRAGPEIDYSKTTNSCFTSPPTPKALPLPPQICVSCVQKPYPSRCPVCLTSRLLWLRGRPSIRFIFSEQTSNHRSPVSFAVRFILHYSHPGRTFERALTVSFCDPSYQTT